PRAHAQRDDDDGKQVGARLRRTCRRRHQALAAGSPRDPVSRAARHEHRRRVVQRYVSRGHRRAPPIRARLDGAVHHRRDHVTPVRRGFDAWEEAYRAASRSLSIVRVLFGATFLLLLLPRFQWMVGFPDTFFHPPPGLTSGLAGFPPRGYFIAVDAVLITAAVFLTAGRHVTVASVLIS